ncbi:MAG TPA: hypothetical protein VEY95_13105 [Azospirillaceae bacterium]|nr:hypothetical protein [Azospirillaceae bacterium]
MIGRTAIVWTGLAAIAGGVLFQTSYQVQSLNRELRAVNRQIVEERETIHILKAEWSYLNEPTRLERLAKQFTQLRPTGAEQMVGLEAIPAKLPPGAAPSAPAEVPTARGPARRAGNQNVAATGAQGVTR